MVGITGDPRMLILDGLTAFGISVVCSGVWSTGVECRVSVRSGALRSGQLGSSGCLMAAPCAGTAAVVTAVFVFFCLLFLLRTLFCCILSD